MIKTDAQLSAAIEKEVRLALSAGHAPLAQEPVDDQIEE